MTGDKELPIENKKKKKPEAKMTVPGKDAVTDSNLDDFPGCHKQASRRYKGSTIYVHDTSCKKHSMYRVVLYPGVERQFSWRKPGVDAAHDAWSRAVSLLREYHKVS